MALTETRVEVLQETGKMLKGSNRRVLMASVVKGFGQGGQRQAEKELAWDRGTIRKGLCALESEFECAANFSARGRQPRAYHLPELLNDIAAIAEGEAQTGPTFKTTRKYIRGSAAEVRKQRVKEKGYSEAEFPCEDTIPGETGDTRRRKLNQRGYYPKKVRKSQPMKKIPETDTIFEQLKQVNTAADADETKLRMSVDAKGTILLERLSRGGFSRIAVKALDHDFRPDKRVTPVGVFLPPYNELYLFLSTGSVTSDALGDCIETIWATMAARFPLVQTLVIHQDNGPACHRRRTQFMSHITTFADQAQIHIQLA